MRSPNQSAILSDYLTTLAFIVLYSHIDARYIVRFKAFVSHNVCFRSSQFRTNTFPYTIILATVYDPILNFFGRTIILSLLLMRLNWALGGHVLSPCSSSMFCWPSCEVSLASSLKFNVCDRIYDSETSETWNRKIYRPEIQSKTSVSIIRSVKHNMIHKSCQSSLDKRRIPIPAWNGDNQ